MSSRMFPVLLCVLSLIAVAGFSIANRSSAQEPPAVWNSAMVWQPGLVESGDAIAELVNQIDAACNVDVDPVQASGGAGPEGAVYAFSVNWACPSGGAGVSTWNSAMVWQPTLGEAGDAMSALVNQIDASCAVDVDPVQASGGTGPEGPVYAFVVTWACR